MCLIDPYDERTPIVHVNTAFESLTGFPQREAVGEDVLRLLQVSLASAAALLRLDINTLDYGISLPPFLACYRMASPAPYLKRSCALS